MKRAHIFVSGFVQGVSFRHFVKRKAQEIGLTGWVKNLPDGRVEVAIQGSKGKIEEIILLCRKGPFLSEVGDVGVKWEEPEKECSSFDIIN